MREKLDHIELFNPSKSHRSAEATKAKKSQRMAFSRGSQVSKPLSDL